MLLVVLPRQRLAELAVVADGGWRLYQLRWGIEEGYKMYKARVQVEAFSGKTATAVKQDIYAKIMMMNLWAALAFPIEEMVVKEYRVRLDPSPPFFLYSEDTISCMNKYGQILYLLRQYDYLGKKEYPDGTALFGKAPHIAPLAWLHTIYAPLSDEQIQQLEANLQMEIPEDYAAFLKVSNGLGVFQKMNLYGYRSNYQRTVEAAQVQPFDILIPNTWERPSNAGPHVFYIGGYTAGNGAWIYLDANDSTVHLCERWQATSRYRWDSFEDFLRSEMNRLMPLFDKEGKLLSPNTDTRPTSI